MEISRRSRAVALSILCLLTLLAAGPGMALPVQHGYSSANGILSPAKVQESLAAQRQEAAGVGGCGPGRCVGNSFCDGCVCYAPSAPISQVACRCHLIDPSCGLGECVGNGAYCEGPFCPFPVCYAASSTISLVLCQGGILGPDCKLTCVQPPFGMKAWWPFDETSGTQAFDIIGSNHGTYQNGPVPTAGKVAHALSFDGVNDYVNAPAVTTHDYLNLTLDAWIRPDATSSTGRTIVSFGGLIYSLLLEGDELRFVIQPDPVSYTPVSNGANIPLGVWTHVAVVADATAKEIRWYVNGSLVTVFTQYVANYAYINPSWGWTIGGGVFGVDYFQGAIDELEIFERPLAQSEIQAIYNAGPKGKCKIMR